MLTVEHDLSGNRLIYSLSPTDAWVEFQLDFLIQQRPSFALETAIRIKDNQAQLVMQVDGLQTAETIDAQSDYSVERGQQRLAEILKAYQLAEDALFTPDQMLLAPSQVFLEPRSGRVRLAILPVTGQNRPDSVETLLQSIATAYQLSDDTVAQQLAVFRPQAKNEPAKPIQTPAESPQDNTPDLVTPATPPGEPVPRERGRAFPVILLVSHGLLPLLAALPWLTQLDLAFLPLEIALPEQLHPWLSPALMILTIVLLSLDLWFLKPWSRRSTQSGTHPNRRHGKVKPAEKGKSPPIPTTNTVADLTQLLQVSQSAYRLGLLSVGLPGTPQETEGLRAYILVDEFLIGRDDAICDLPLPATSVGRRHARITRREGSFFITDLGSKNGTKLDGRNLNKHEDYLLPDRCRIEFADQAFYFVAD